MTIVRFDSVGGAGIIKDVNPYELAPEAWSEGQNVRFRYGRVHKFLGHQAVFGSASVAPYWLLPVQTPTTHYWVYGGLTKVYTTDMSTHFNITRQTAGVDVDYAATADKKWNGCVLNGVPILNNGVDVPQMWTPVSGSQRLAALSNWPAGVTANIVRGFKNYLLALDVTEAGTRNSRLLRWSHPADPGAVPASWDYTDTTKDAGRVEMSDTPGALLDSVPLLGVNVLYKEDAIYLMQYVGGTFVFRFDKILPRMGGLLATHCACELNGLHFVATQNDIIVHNGREPRSLLDGKRRQQYTSQGFIDQTYKQRSFVVANAAKDEVWFCFPENGHSQPNRAWVFGGNGTIGDRNLAYDCAFADVGIVNPSAAATTWDSMSGTYDTQARIWDLRTYDPTMSSLVLARSDGTNQLYWADQTNQFAGTSFTAYAERTGLSVTGRDRLGNWKADPTTVKFVRRIVPRVRSNGALNVYVGAQYNKDGAVTWDGPHSFDPATDQEVLCSVTGRFLAVRFESTGNTWWELDGYDLDVEIVGAY